MDYADFAALMQHNADRIAAMLAGVSTEQSRWKPDPDSWSMLEVINHLYDEERLDFRVRLDLILQQSEQEWPPIDPQGWVTERDYNQRQLQESLEDFLQERQASLEWLHSLGTVDWDTVHTSEFGSMRAGDMFSAWVTHDQLHLRQLVELHRGYTELQAAPYDLGYAGEW